MSESVFETNKDFSLRKRRWTMLDLRIYMGAKLLRTHITSNKPRNEHCMELNPKLYMRWNAIVADFGKEEGGSN